MAALQIAYKPIASLKPYAGNARKHTARQIHKIAESIETFGWTNPILIDDQGLVLAGHGRLMAAKKLGLEMAPTVMLSSMSEAEKRAYILADNRLAELAGWDDGMLRTELAFLIEVPELDVTLTGFELPQIEGLLDTDDQQAPADPADEIIEPETIAVSRLGDLWDLGPHRVYCGDATQEGSYKALLGEETADLVFTDPPYNVPIQGHVGGLGKVRHREFAFASGEMSEAQFSGFLEAALGHHAAFSAPGAIHFVCMDWAHLRTLLCVGNQVYDALKNICVWNKTNGGMGSLYRSQHEMIAVFKVGGGGHVNNVLLGKYGRYRTNVWTYAGVNAFKRGRDDELGMHPTVKPVAMLAQAIRDCSKAKGIVLDGFGGSGSTLVAAEKTNRRARLIEYDPLYVDVIIRRWQKLTGKAAVLVASGETFDARAAAGGVGVPAAHKKEARR